MNNLLPFQGFISQGMYLSSGYSVWLFHWDSTPAIVNSFSEIWLVTPGGKRVCYISSELSIPIFHIYHQFDEVWASEFTMEWVTTEILKVTVRAESGGEVELVINTTTTISESIVNKLLKTRLKVLFSQKGKTETSMGYFHQPHRICKVETVSGRLNGIDLGELSKPDLPVKIGDSQVSDKPLISFCTHYLERNEAIEEFLQGNIVDG